MENLYVIVVTYNAEKWIQKCLNSLLNTNYKLQIIVIDNNSIDNTKSLLSSFSENIEIISLNKNKGFGLANNIGIKIAMDRNADFVFLINQDAYVTNETIPNLLSEAIKNSEYGILSPIHLNGIGTKLDYNFSIQVSPLNCNDFFSDFVIGDNIESVYNCKFVNAAAWLISKKCINVVGYFSPFFFLYGEDDNYVDRLKYHGFRIGVVPKSIIFHDREDRGGKKILKVFVVII